MIVIERNSSDKINIKESDLYENIILGWVMHEQSIIDEILKRLNTKSCDLHLISLVCDEETLKLRLKNDVDKGIRDDDIINRSLARLKYYNSLLTQKIDVSKLTPTEVAEYIITNC